MILFNAMSLHQPIQNVLIINISMDFNLSLLVCWEFHCKTCGTMTFYIMQHENLLRFSLYLQYSHGGFKPKFKIFYSYYNSPSLLS